MLATRPAAGPALAGFQAFTSPSDAFLPGLILFRGIDPADPFIAGERGDVFPSCQGGRIRLQRFLEVVGEFMDDASGESFGRGHG